jgi:hypothetical protein
MKAVAASEQPVGSFAPRASVQPAGRVDHKRCIRITRLAILWLGLATVVACGRPTPGPAMVDVSAAPAEVQAVSEPASR